MTKKGQHPNLVTVRGADALRREQDRLAKAGYFPAPMPDDFGHSSSGGSGIGHSWEEYIHARLMCSESGKGSGGYQFPVIHLSSGGEVMTPDNVGTKGLGYMAWGADNRKPNLVSFFRETSPYTASAHRFNTDLCAGRGPRPVYAYTQYVGGNLTEKRVPLKDAGVLIKGWLRDLKRELQNEKQNNATVPDASASAIITTATVPDGSPSGESPLIADLEAQIAELEAAYDRWKETNEELNGNLAEGKIGFLQRNNLHLSWLQLTEDMQDQNICFPEIMLSRRQLDKDGKNVPTRLWNPRIVGIRYKSAHSCRLERMDNNGRINYVYTSSRWIDEPGTREKKEDMEVNAIPALDPQQPLTDLERIVRETRKDNGSIRKRPTHFILPVAYPSAGRPYYPFPAWQSILSGDIYEYLVTMISDRNKRRKNSNVIGRIIYLNQEYMERLYHQSKADTPDAKKEVFTKLRNQINAFLEDRDNMGKPLVAYTFLGSDGKTYESWKIVEIESNSKSVAEANKEELAEISSVVFFAFGLDSQLVGNTPGTTTRSGGTDLRERYLLKQLQMSPMQQLLLLPLYLLKYFNRLDDHLEWEIPREVLTTLDNSKSGITTQPQE